MEEFLPEMKQLLEQYFLSLFGKRAMKADLDMGGFDLKNWSLPTHDNAFHSPDFLSGLTLVPNFFQTGEVSVGSASEAVVASASVAVSPQSRYYVYLFFLCNFRWLSVEGTPDIEFWFTVNGTQRSAKFPVQGVDLGRHPFMTAITIRDMSDGIYWIMGFTEGTYLFEVRAQTTAQTCYISHRQLDAIYGIKQEK